MTLTNSAIPANSSSSTVVTCAVSGLTFPIPYGFLDSAKLSHHRSNSPAHRFVHPDLHTTKSSLDNLLPMFRAYVQDSESLPAPDSSEPWNTSPASVNRYLYSLAWLLQLGVEFRKPANPATAYLALVKYFDSLVAAVNTVNANRSLTFPSFTHDYPDSIADNLPGWIDAINGVIADAEERARTTNRQVKIQKYETLLDPVSSISADYIAHRYAKPISEWANLAAQFPASVSAIWRETIYHLFRNDTFKLFELQVTEGDLSELVAHCEDNLPHGTYYAHELLKRLRSAHGMLLEIMSHGQGTVTVSAHTEPEPKQSDFPTRGAYIRARIKWQASRVTVTGSQDSIYMDI